MDAPQKIGRYEIIDELGRGAMGAVYRAKDPAMDRVVALKTIISAVLASEQGAQFRERFFREARAAGALAHPGIVPVFDVGEHEGMPFLVMEFITGKTLADAVKKGERLDLDRARQIAQKVAEALGYAHQRGVVHRDIKPANILLTSRETYGIERPKITDFGVAKLAEGQTTMTGQMLGTPAYMPPEQFTGAPIDGRADIFSLGVVLYWMATGEQPFPGESMTAVSYKVVHTEPVPPRKLNPAIPAKLESVILKCLAKSPADRYQTGEELAAELADMTTATRTTPTPQPSAHIDPDATVVVTKPTMGAPTVAPPPNTVATQSTRGALVPMIIAIVAAVLIVAAAGWYVMRPKAPAAAQTPAPVAASAVTTPAAPESSAQKGVDATARAAPAPSLKKIAPAEAPAASAAVKTPSAKPEAASTAPSLPTASTPEPAAMSFDPKALDPKQNAALKIDATKMPAGVDFTVMMNGKIYFRKTADAPKLQDETFFVPPGFQELRVTAQSGAVEKISNTVSAEFKAKKKNSLKIELRTQGAPEGSGVPQGLYPDTQIVLTLK